MTIDPIGSVESDDVARLRDEGLVIQYPERRRIADDIEQMRSALRRTADMNYAETQRMLKGWRGRRLLACQAAETLAAVIRELGQDNGVDPFQGDSSKVDGEVPHVSDPIKRELDNILAGLLRLVLLHNDGRVSPQHLRRF
jgi:hypothetical protein